MVQTPHDPGDTSTGGLSRIGPRLRDLRRRSGLTLEAAAARVGLSPAHLSRLETGLRQPSLPVLLDLARVYGTTASDVLGEVPPEREPIFRGRSMPATESGGWTYWRAGGSGRAMQALRVHLPRGLHVQEELVRAHPGEEWLYVTRGTLRLTLADATHLLEPGDAAHFDSLVPHRLASVSAGGTEVLFVHTLLQSGAADLCLGPAPGAGRGAR